MRNTTFEIEIQFSNKGDQVVRSVTTEPIHQGIVDQISSHLPRIIPLDGEVDGVTISFSVKRNSKGEMVHENKVPKELEISGHFMEMLEGLTYRGFQEVEQFEQAMEAFQLGDQVDQLVGRILGKPELAGTIEAMTVEIGKPCQNCGGYHEETHGDVRMDVRSLEGIPVGFRDMVKDMFNRIGGMFGGTRRNGKDDGLTFAICDRVIASSPFAALAPERLKPLVVKAVQDGIVVAFESNVEMFTGNVTSLDDAKRQLEADITRLDERRVVQVGQAAKLKELAVALGDHGITLSIAALETGPFMEALPVPTITDQPDA